jgi:hypothetical protein
VGAKETKFETAFRAQYKFVFVGKHDIRNRTLIFCIIKFLTMVSEG